jgi:TolB protein
MDIYLYSIKSGEVRPLASDSVTLYGPSWAPGGDQVLYTAQSGQDSDVYAIGTSGDGPANLTNPQGYDGNASYSPDGQIIVFVSDRNGLAEGAAGRDLWLMDSNGSNARSLTRNTMYEGGPRFSPDGLRIAFCRQIPTGEDTQDGEIFVVDRDGGNEIRVTNEPGFDCLPDWSPDGRELTFHGCREDGCFIYVADDDGSGLRRITNDTYGGQWPR